MTIRDRLYTGNREPTVDELLDDEIAGLLMRGDGIRLTDVRQIAKDTKTAIYDCARIMNDGVDATRWPLYGITLTNGPPRVSLSLIKATASPLGAMMAHLRDWTSANRVLRRSFSAYPLASGGSRNGFNTH